MLHSLPATRPTVQTKTRSVKVNYSHIRWSNAQWRRQMRTWLTSGVTCKLHHLSAGLFPFPATGSVRLDRSEHLISHLDHLSGRLNLKGCHHYVYYGDRAWNCRYRPNSNYRKQLSLFGNQSWYRFASSFNTFHCATKYQSVLDNCCVTYCV